MKLVSKDKDSINDEDDTQSVNSPGQEEWKVFVFSLENFEIFKNSVAIAN